MATQSQPQTPATVDPNKAEIIRILQSDKFKAQLIPALQDRISPDFMLRAVMANFAGQDYTATQLRRCDPITVAASVLQLAMAGLAPEPFKGQCYLIPRYNGSLYGKGKGGMECTALIGYRGYVVMAYRTKKVTRFEANVVYEGDEFELSLGTGEPPVHKPWMNREPFPEQRGNILGAYAVVKLDTGENLVEWMTKDDIDKTMGRSQTADSSYSPWKSDYAEMARKTPARRISKWVPDAELQGIAAMEEARDLGKMAITLDAGEIRMEERPGAGTAEEQKSDEVTEPKTTQQAEPPEQTESGKRTATPFPRAESEDKAISTPQRNKLFAQARQHGWSDVESWLQLWSAIEPVFGYTAPGQIPKSPPAVFDAVLAFVAEGPKQKAEPKADGAQPTGAELFPPQAK